MGIERTGVELVADGSNQFISALNGASQALNTWTANLQNTGAPGLARDTQQAEGGVNNLAGALFQGVVAGNLFTQAIDFVGSSIKNLWNTGVQAVSAMQDLQVNLESLAAREILYSGVTDDMNQALGMGAPLAADMTEKLKQLSIQSPFQWQEIQSIFQLNMAFGQSSEMALKLTGAITNLGAISKGIPGILNRLAYNFSQMSMTGKITARDTRDLAMAGLDLAKVFDLTLHKSVKEVNADLQSGKITFEEVSQALVDYTDKYIGPAAARAARTWGGLQSTLKDVSFFASANLLKPAFDRITVALGGLLDKVVAFVNSPGFVAMGVMFDALAENALKLAGNLEQGATAAVDQYGVAIGTAVQSADYAFQGAVWDAFEWGVSIITSLADGIINGASTVLVGAMDFVGQVLGFYLKANSPPRVAPDLTKWGIGAIDSWLKGFTQADFSILDGIQAPIKQALSFMSSAGIIDQNQLNDTFSNLSKDIIKAMNAGITGDKSVNTADLFAKIAAATGPFGAEVAKLTQQQFALATATRAAEQAQKALTAAQEREFNAGKQVNSLTQEYNDLLRKGADKATLKAKLAEINAAEKARQAAQKDRVEAEKGVTASNKEVTTIQEQLKLQQALIQQLTELAQARIVTPEKNKGGGGGTPEGAGGAKTKVPEIPTAEAMFDKIRQNFLKKMDKIFAPMMLKWRTEWQPILVDLQIRWAVFTANLQKTWGPAWANIQAALGTAWAFISNIWTAAVTVYGNTIGKIGEAIMFSAPAWGVIFQNFGYILQNVFIVIGVAAGALLAIISAVFTGIVNGILTAIQFAWIPFTVFIKGISDILAGVVQFVKGFLELIWGLITGNGELIKAGWNDLWNGVLKTVVGIFETIGGAIATAVTFITGLLAGFITGVIDFFKNLYMQLIGGSIIPEMISDIISGFTGMFTDLISMFGTKLAELATNVGTFLTGIVTTITGYASQFITAGAALIQGLIDGITSMIDTVLTTASNLGQSIIDIFKNLFKWDSPSKVFIEMGKANMEGLDIGMNDERRKQEAHKYNGTGLTGQTVEALEYKSRMGKLAGGGGNKEVNIQFGNVTITNPAEGELFQARVERAVRDAIGA